MLHILLKCQRVSTAKNWYFLDSPCAAATPRPTTPHSVSWNVFPAPDGRVVMGGCVSRFLLEWGSCWRIGLTLDPSRLQVYRWISERTWKNPANIDGKTLWPAALFCLEHQHDAFFFKVKSALTLLTELAQGGLIRIFPLSRVLWMNICKSLFRMDFLVPRETSWGHWYLWSFHISCISLVGRIIFIIIKWFVG